MILYKKVGRKYIPIKDTEATGGLSNGSWLVVIKKGSTSIRQQLNPDTANLYAAALECERELVPKVNEIMASLKLQNKPFTEQQLKLWKRLQKSLQVEALSIYTAGAHDVVTELMKYLINKVESWTNKRSW